MGHCVREVREELGLDRPLGRLLVIDFTPTAGVMPEGMAFVWDGGVLSNDEFAGLTLTDPEIKSVKFCTLAEVASLVRPRMVGRIEAALQGIDAEAIVLCESGRPVTQG